MSEIHIEGEIPAPQVLFVTARDQRRFVDFQHHRYLRSCRQLAEATPFPTHRVPVGHRPAPGASDLGAGAP